MVPLYWTFVYLGGGYIQQCSKKKKHFSTWALRVCPVATLEWRYDIPVQQLETSARKSSSFNFPSFCRRYVTQIQRNSTATTTTTTNKQQSTTISILDSTCKCLHGLSYEFHSRILQLAMNRSGNSVVWMVFVQDSSRIYKLAI